MNTFGKWLRARWILGWAALKNLVWRAVGRGRRLGPWQSTLMGEGLGTVPKDAWSYLGATSRCLGCGLCDLAGARDERISGWLLADARRPEDAPLARLHAARLRVLAVEIAAVCPAGVRGEVVARLIDDNAAMLRS